MKGVFLIGVNLCDVWFNVVELDGVDLWAVDLIGVSLNDIISIVGVDFILV